MITNTLADYNLWLVGVSCLVAFVGAFAGLTLTRYMADIDGDIYGGWLLLAGLVLSSCAIWATHFVGMLAFEPGVAVSYDIALTALSFVAPLPLTVAGLYLVARTRDNVFRLLSAGLLMGLGVATMHYIGMAAVRIEAAMTYDPVLLAASIGLAIVMSTAGLRMAARSRRGVRRWPSAAVLAAGVTAMHYTAMAAMELHPVTTNIEYFEGALTRETTGFAAGFAIVLGVLIASVSVLGRELGNAIADRDDTAGYS